MAFFLFGVDKEAINLEETNTFNWRKLKEENFAKLIQLIKDF